MGNNSSKPAGSSVDSPNASPTSLRSEDSSTSGRRPRGRDSHVLPSAKPVSAAAPVASFESATGQSSYSRKSNSSSRGRSHTVTGNTEVESELAENKSSQSPRSVQIPPYTPGAPQLSNKESTPSPKSNAASSPTPYYLPTSQFGRPPRLPLAIEEEILSPGSPIITQADLEAPSKQKNDDDDTSIGRRPSVLSSTTADDDDDLGEESIEALNSGEGEFAKTPILWKEGGEKVYVTGTFASFWTKKYRMHKKKDPDDPERDTKTFEAVVPLAPGTHHLTFLVDGASRTSKHIPTAVDYTNMLVNYVEVTQDEVSKATQAQNTPDRASTKSTTSDQRPITASQSSQALPPPTPELKPAATSTAQPQAQSSDTPNTPSRRHIERPAKRLPESKYHNEIPAFLLDLDAPEDSSRFRRANAVMGTQPVPPTLPMFLNKSILNGATPMKDDASVLIMPNHTVLNHLATSSIKDGVLATSATTRYKKKYVTTIMYKPTGDLSSH